MAVICFSLSFLTSVHTTSMVSHAATFRGRNIWAGGAEIINGRSRNYLYRWTDGWQMTFCIMPGNHMGSTVTAAAIRTNVEDEDIPYIDSREDYERLAMVCSWYDANGSVSADNATYAAAQTAVWAIVGDGWESGDSLAVLVDKHIKGTYDRWITLRDYVEDVDGGSLPDWCSVSSVSGKTQPMRLENGQWLAELDLAGNPKLASLNWVFEGDAKGWMKSVRNGKLCFSYSGGGGREMTVSAVLPEEMKSLAKNTTSLNLYIPNGDPDRIQAMISAGPYEGKLYVKLECSAGVPGGSSGGGSEGGFEEAFLEPEVVIYEHTETFVSHYNLELEKVCAETDQPLEDAVFQIKEAFDRSQIRGRLKAGCMSPVPDNGDDYRLCAEARTDENGHFSHTDKKTYTYSKTYCDGHPEPEYLEIPDIPPSGAEGGIKEEELAAIEAANAEAKEKWEALIKACESETDFHSEEPGEGLKMMLEDRQKTYEQFICLKYDYAVEEIQARYGYIRHGLHDGDEPIPVIRLASAESEAPYEVIGSQGKTMISSRVRQLHQAAGDFPANATASNAAPARATSSNASAFNADKLLSDTAWMKATPGEAGYLYRPARIFDGSRSNHDLWEEADEALPIPVEDEVAWIEPAGDASRAGYTYHISNHRTEGEIHMKKKDLELSLEETQGDAVLKGAVYGLYAAEDIVHPDGKTGVVYQKDELTAEAVTDEEGNASFTCYTRQPEHDRGVEWTGHPLILGQYYIKEIARSEGYELSVSGRDQEITNIHTDEGKMPQNGRADVVTAMAHPIDMHDGSWLEFDVVFQNVTNGFDLFVSGYPEDSTFYRSRMEETAGTEQVVTGTRLVFSGEYERAEAGEYKLDSEGNYLPVTDEAGNTVWDRQSPVSGTYYMMPRLKYYPGEAVEPKVDPEKWADPLNIDTEYVQEEVNGMLEQMGYVLLDPEHGDDAPWTVLSLSGETNQELGIEILDWFSEHSFWDSASVHRIWLEDGRYKAVVFHDYRRLPARCIYDEMADAVYVKQEIQVEGMGLRHMYAEYPASEVQVQGSYVTIPQIRSVEGTVEFPKSLEEHCRPVYHPLYQRYEEGEYRLDGAGERIPIYRTEYVYEEKEEVSSEYELSPLASSYDRESGTHKIHVENLYDWELVQEPITMTVRAVAEGRTTYDAGNEEFYSDYLSDVQGAGASAFASIRLPEDSYIKIVSLTYPGQISVVQDGSGIPGQGTGKEPVLTEQRIIKQKIKVMKDILQLNEGEAEVSKLSNFRFKAYLKSNLERLYRNEDGEIIWINQEGELQDPAEYGRDTQALVPVFHTRGEQDGTYRRVLETVSREDGTSSCQYEKFFHALRVANHDKWDDAAPSYTSYRPVGNQKNRTKYTQANRMVSDQVRQFAIDWYLDDEVKALTKPFGQTDASRMTKERQACEESLSYGDELYDEALHYALIKAEDYLKPFFKYDLDSIYSIKWDQEAEGGSDRDTTTVSADREAQLHYEGVSSYLPYGVYVIVEQQPQYAELNDYFNKHYGIDVPKEVMVPSVYGDRDSFYQVPAAFSPYYRYHKSMSQAELWEKYKIYPDVQRLEEDRYLHMLVPWSMTEPEREEEDLKPLPGGESRYYGYAGIQFRDIHYRAALRIEKLDSETHENLLHEEAVFAIYKAECDRLEDGDGRVKVYEEDTMISGTKEFLESAGAKRITPMVRSRNLLISQSVPPGIGAQYTGVVKAGTPIFREEDQIVMEDVEGNQIGEFCYFSTSRDGAMQQVDEDETDFCGLQNVGYLETPEPLEAGVYVLVERKAPAGYRRMKPMAVEIYSDQVTYYQNGDAGNRVLAALYDSDSRENTDEDQAVIYAENEPIKVQIEKVKESSADRTYATDDKTVTWRFSGRVDGSLAQIGDDPNYEYAYLNGEYQGYGWRKGTLEYLTALKNAGHQVEIAYDGTLFAGYGYITDQLESADDENPYVPGALMTLYEAAELIPSGKQGDGAYENLTIERNLSQEVTRMFLKDGQDILYYDLSHLTVFEYSWADGQRVCYGYDENHQKVSIQQLEQERRNHEKTDKECSIYAFRDGLPYLELAGGDFSNVFYSYDNPYFSGEFAKLIRDRHGNYTMTEGMKLYHVDREGNRDGLVDPQTGMAYVLKTEEGYAEQETTRVLVWPVKAWRDHYGNVIAKDKITTFRVATVGEQDQEAISEDYPESGYITGTWRSGNQEKSHQAETIVKNVYGQSMNGEPVLVKNAGQLEKHVNPVLDQHGRVIYYQKEESEYQEELPLYDRDGDFVRQKPADLLNHYDSAGYAAGGEKRLHRQGESYVLENTWISGDKTPNDPFHLEMTEGQADLLTRVPAGTYILEEVMAPEGYLKGFPTGVIVTDTEDRQAVQMVDHAVKAMIGKLDGTEDPVYQILDMGNPDSDGGYPVLGTAVEGKGAYGYHPVAGAKLKLSSLSESWEKTWTTSEGYQYVENIPVGRYLLEEVETPSGFVTAERKRIRINHTGEVQNYLAYNDHTKVEVEKYMLENEERTLVSGAGFTLFQAKVDDRNQILYEDGRPQYDEGEAVMSWESSDCAEYKGFIPAFEEMYREHGVIGATVSWETKEKQYTAVLKQQECIDASAAGGERTMYPTTATLFYQMDDGRQIRVTVYQQQDNRQGADFRFEYQFDYRKLPKINDYAVSYVTLDGMRRFDYLPVGDVYVLVETEVPKGFSKAEDVVITVRDFADIQRYSVENRESMLMISKTAESSLAELKGAHMALYRADAQGELIQDDAYLAAAWISGTDGVYTELDKINRRIPEGYKEGDLKPHTLRRLPDGVYYLVERKAPDYYMVMKPEKIVYQQEDEIQLIRVSDRLVQGEILVRKTDTEDRPLSGAVFRLTTYLGTEKTAVREYSEHEGELLISNLPVGQIKPDGSVEPYRYELQEIIPPKGYAVKAEPDTIVFAPGSYEYQSTARKAVTVVNEQTRIQIGKAILEQVMDGGPDSYVEGAELALYEVTGRDMYGDYLYQEDKPVAEWVTKRMEAVKEITGLVAGQTYILLEKAAPEGLRKIRPIAFSISMDGRRIEQIYSDLCILSVENKGDEIEAVRIRGRRCIGVEIAVEDGQGDQVACWIAAGGEHGINRMDSLQDGEIIVIQETVIYSDGAREVISRTTKEVRYVNDVIWIPERTVRKVLLELRDEAGNVIGSKIFRSDAEEPESLEWMIRNSKKHDGEGADWLFRKGSEYQFVETSYFSDGSCMSSGKMGFSINDRAEIRMITAFDKEYGVEIIKQDAAGTVELPGARLQILDQQGDVIEEWTSDGTPYMVAAKLVPRERYVLREDVAPAGWSYASDIAFMISEQGIRETVIMEDLPTHVQVRKTDITGTKEVPGAALQILDHDGTVLEEWISGTGPHEIIGVLQAEKEYILHERSAPEGYAYAEDVKFRVSKDGRIDQVVMKDEKLPHTPPEDEEEPHKKEEPHEKEDPNKEKEPEKPEDIPEPDNRIGRIIAVYKSKRFGNGEHFFEGFSRVTVPKLGDENRTDGRIFLLLGISVFCGAAALVMGRMQRNTQEESKKEVLKKRRGAHFHCWLVIIFLMSVLPMKVYAAASGEEGLTVTFDAFTEDCQSPKRPPQKYKYQGQIYQLSSMQQVAAMIPETCRYIEKTIIYEEVEQADELPGTIEMEVKDHDTGVSTKAELPVLKTQFDHWRWIAGFEFTITVQQYDLGRFYLGDKIVEEEEGELFEGYEEDLLGLIGVDPAYYRIDRIQWITDAWTGEDGLVYRQAKAGGQKYVADCRVTYGGDVKLPETEGIAWQAEYAPETVESDTEPDTGVPSSGKEGRWHQIWQRYSRQITVVSIGLLFFLLLGLGIFVYKKANSVYD